MVCPPTLFFFFKTVLAILVSYHFHMKFSNSWSTFLEKFGTWDFEMKCVELVDKFGAIFLFS